MAGVGGPFYECHAGATLTYNAGWLPKVKKAVPVSDRVLRSQVANKLVAKLSFD